MLCGAGFFRDPHAAGFIGEQLLRSFQRPLRGIQPDLRLRDLAIRDGLEFRELENLSTILRWGKIHQRLGSGSHFQGQADFPAIQPRLRRDLPRHLHGRNAKAFGSFRCQGDGGEVRFLDGVEDCGLGRCGGGSRRAIGSMDAEARQR